MFGNERTFRVSLNIDESALFQEEIPKETHQLPFGFASGALHFQFEKKPTQVKESKISGLLDLSSMVFMLSVVLLVLYAYLFWHLVPVQDFSEQTIWEGRGWYQLLGIQVTGGLFIVSMLKCMLESPGSISSELRLQVEQVVGNRYHVVMTEELLSKLQAKDRKRSLLPRYCKTCILVKPDRSHHCSVCNYCVLRMDHHCSYINNCVGLNNYKYFINMINYSALASVLVTCTMWEGLLLAWENPKNTVLFQAVFGIVYFANTLLSVVLVGFNSFHYYLILNALTTIEFYEKKSVHFEVSPYHQSLKSNWLAVFGTNPLAWFLPIKPNSSDTLTFEKPELSAFN